MSRGLRFSITASDRSRAAFSSVQNNIRKTQGLQRSWNAGLNANRRAVQQFGFQMSDFAIQVAGGQSAMLAFTQQGGQMLQFFGPAGAIAAAFLAVFGSLAIAFTRSGKALSDLTPILGVLSDDFAAIGRSLVVVKEILIDFTNVVLNNMDRIIITVTVLVGIMAGRWVAAFIAARLATFTLVGALLALRGALIRTGIGALIVGAGELVYQFTRLVKGAGSVGNAFKLMGAVAVEVFNRIIQAHRLVPLAIKAGASLMAAFFIERLNRMMSAFIEFTWTVADGLNNLFGTNLTGASAVVTQELALMSQGFRDTAGTATGEMGRIKDAISAPLSSIQKLVDAVRAADKEGRDIDIRDWFKGGAGDEDGGSGGGRSISDKLSEEAKRIKSAFDGISQSISGALGTAFKSLTDRTKSLKDIAVDALTSILNKLTETMLNPVWEYIGNSITGMLLGTSSSTGSGFSGGLLSGIFSSIFGSFAGGGSTGKGSRSGGLDGRGGKLAIVHPRERIYDETRQQGPDDAGMNVEVHIHENASDGETTVQQSGGRIDVFLRRAVSDAISSGGADRALRDRFDVRPKAMGV